MVGFSKAKNIARDPGDEHVDPVIPPVKNGSLRILVPGLIKGAVEVLDAAGETTDFCYIDFSNLTDFKAFLQSLNYSAATVVTPVLPSLKWTRADFIVR